MSIIKTAIEGSHWDLAAHALVLATILTLNGEKNDVRERENQRESGACREDQKGRVLYQSAEQC
jgi:hypothetical protein